MKRENCVWFSKISSLARTAFLSAVLWGLVAHGMALTNKFSTHDDVAFLFMTGSTINLGRWMLYVVGWLETLLFGDGHYSLPMINGLLSLCCIGFAAGLMTDLLGLRKKRSSAALGGFMAVFPTVTGLFGYMFTAHYYMLAMLMMVCSVWLICRVNTWWAATFAVLLGGCSIGIYQAFLPMLLSLMLFFDLRYLSEKKDRIGDFLKLAAGQALCTLGIMALYFAANRFFLVKFQIEQISYMGISEVGSTPLKTYLERAGIAYREFFYPTRYVSSDMFPMHVWYLHAAMVAAEALLGLRLVIHTMAEQKYRTAALLILLLLLVPLGCNFIFVMAEYVHGLMTYSQVAQLALFLWLTDRLEIRREGLRRAASCVFAAALGLAGIMYVRYDNQCYLKTNFQQQAAISWYSALTARIKSTPGYQQDLPVAFLNGEDKQDLTLYNIDELNFISEPPYADDITEYLNSYSWKAFMERWCGFSPVYADPAEWEDREEIRNMPHYPDDGSVRIIDETVIVNF